MKIQFQSDLHLEHYQDDITYQITETHADVIVLAGDIGASNSKTLDWLIQQSAKKPIIFCLGNHEFYDDEYHRVLDFWRSALISSDVFFLQDDQLIIDDTLFIGATLWTDYAIKGADKKKAVMTESARRMNDHYHIHMQKNGHQCLFQPKDALAIHQQSLGFIRQSLDKSLQQKKVVITHHAPSLQSIPAQYQQQLLCGAFASDLEALIRKYQPHCWIHGHLHNSSSYKVGNTHILANPKGGITDANPEFNPQAIINL